jgi:outer membrane lipoprotein-sorting protein
MLLMSIGVMAQTGFSTMKNQEQFKNALTETTRRTLTMESKFTQEKNLDVISEKILSSGSFLFKQENKLRWEYTAPFRYLIVMNGDKILVKDESKENRFDASSNKLFSEINAIMIGCIRGTILGNDKQFTFDYLENSEFYLLRLHPLSAKLKGSLSEIRVFLDKKTYLVSRLEIHEASGDFTKILFSGMKINTVLSDEVFKIK